MGKINYNAAQVKSVFDHHKGEDKIFITSDGNVFLEKHESYAKTHCRDFKQTCESLTRTEFEADQKDGKSKTSAASVSGSTAPAADWKDGKFAEIVEFAKSKGLEATTTKTKGTKALIAEVEAFLATLPSEDPKEESDENEGENSGDDYTPIGGTGEAPKA